MQKKLTRSLNNRMLAGVCSGLGNYFAIDPTLVRILFALIVIFGGLSLWVYIIMWIIIPESY